ncbi:MAG: SurA N-terminal domain-containing protein [Myxococcales bacterium]|nr:SurA N-terminal domain-containing protein [Myxococcales bacterium]
MLDFMRRHSRSYFIYVMFGALIFVFAIYFGPQSEGCSRGETRTVGRVLGSPLRATHINQLFAQFGGNGADPYQRRLQIAEDVALVQYLAAEAREAGLDVSDEQLAEYVTGDMNFDRRQYVDRRTGEFDLETYQMVVPPAMGLPLAAYEDYKADELLVIAYIELLRNAIAVPPAQVSALYAERNTTYTLDYLSVSGERLREYFAPSDSQVADALSQHRGEIEAYFGEHTADFETETELRFSRIFLALTPGEDEENTAKRELRDQILADIEADPSRFAELAAEHSEMGNPEDGGDMGFKTIDRWQDWAGLEGAADAEVGEVINHESRTALTIYRLEERREGGVPEFDAVSEAVTRAWLVAESGDPLVQLAEDLQALAAENSTLEDAVAAYIDAHPVAAEPAPAPSEDAVEGEEEAVQDSEPVANESDEPHPLAALLNVQQTRSFSPAAQRNPSEIPGIGVLPELARDLSSLTDEQPMAPRVYGDAERGFTLVRLNTLSTGAEEPDAEELDAIRADLRRERASYLFGGWEVRLLLHQSAPLPPFLQRTLETATAEGDISFELEWFQAFQQLDPALGEQSEQVSVQ